MGDQRVADEPTFDWKRCADLHNQILDAGWAVIPERPDHVRDMSSWWKHYYGSDEDDNETKEEGEEGEKVRVKVKNNEEQPSGRPDDDHDRSVNELRKRFHPDVIRFLKRAKYDCPGSPDSSTHFFYYVKELSTPQHMTVMLDLTNELIISQPPPTPDRFLHLYMLAGGASGGVIIDQQKMKASIAAHWDVYEIDSEESRFIFTSLEQILRVFLEMIDQERIIAVDPGFDHWNPPEIPLELSPPLGEFHVPWMLPRNDDKIVHDTITAWNGLLASIESRIPGFVGGEPAYYDDEHIQACSPRGFFLEKFLQKARVPRFRFVAPGLRLAFAAELKEQPFKRIADAYVPDPGESQLQLGMYEHKWYPFLFLWADQKVSPKPPREFVFDDYPWANQKEYSSGLYLTHTYTTERCDGCKLLLPFAINENEHAKCGDGSIIMDCRRYIDLYQAGRPILLGLKDLRVELLFRNWARMVESNFWQVDENGVIGGIDKFQDADTLEMCDAYQVKRNW